MENNNPLLHTLWFILLMKLWLIFNLPLIDSGKYGIPIYATTAILQFLADEAEQSSNSIKWWESCRSWWLCWSQLETVEEGHVASQMKGEKWRWFWMLMWRKHIPHCNGITRLLVVDHKYQYVWFSVSQRQICWADLPDTVTSCILAMWLGRFRLVLFSQY